MLLAAEVAAPATIGTIGTAEDVVACAVVGWNAKGIVVAAAAVVAASALVSVSTTAEVAPAIAVVGENVNSDTAAVSTLA
jgi:hypothetical protein